MCAADLAPTLYLIEILHQTTTIFTHTTYKDSCILSKFYIKPQPRCPWFFFSWVVSYRNSTSNHNTPAAVLGSSGLYLIEILHQTTTTIGNGRLHRGCILSKFYIKPQLRGRSGYSRWRCILSKFYIKPQLNFLYLFITFRCILSKFYIKPQHFDFEKRIDYVVSYRNSTSNHNLEEKYQNLRKVVSYRNSTSNHNLYPLPFFRWRVVSYRNSTSNHNSLVNGSWFRALYLIEILHQTTTVDEPQKKCGKLYLIEILHQTTTGNRS